VTVDIGDGALRFLGSVPKSGFSAQEEEMGPKSIVLEFESSSHKSKISIAIEDGKAVADIDKDSGED